MKNILIDDSQVHISSQQDFYKLFPKFKHVLFLRCLCSFRILHSLNFNVIGILILKVADDPLPRRGKMSSAKRARKNVPEEKQSEYPELRKGKRGRGKKKEYLLKGVCQ
ncbi:hypothetical protein CEXT_754551 [Caerostris extrusa]|uniref:Uncharacterized protein n=1 Tax=Caerostris extrusa TaxID=172846 RepID=A0AAV4NRW8_CAEEX|nr:hypothetical protein CEXT_754551 [Caerostris extrusa]